MRECVCACVCVFVCLCVYVRVCGNVRVFACMYSSMHGCRFEVPIQQGGRRSFTAQPFFWAAAMQSYVGTGKLHVCACLCIGLLRVGKPHICLWLLLERPRAEVCDAQHIIIASFCHSLCLCRSFPYIFPPLRLPPRSSYPTLFMYIGLYILADLLQVGRPRSESIIAWGGSGGEFREVI